ncbi:MAG TPA: hypothetical protein PLH11_07840 [Gemmobacter sp.]|nr:hypothetical protein [Gemmobacter sp.]
MTCIKNRISDTSSPCVISPIFTIEAQRDFSQKNRGLAERNAQKKARHRGPQETREQDGAAVPVSCILARTIFDGMPHAATP